MSWFIPQTVSDTVCWCYEYLYGSNQGVDPPEPELLVSTVCQNTRSNHFKKFIKETLPELTETEVKGLMKLFYKVNKTFVINIKSRNFFPFSYLLYQLCGVPGYRGMQKQIEVNLGRKATNQTRLSPSRIEHWNGIWEKICLVQNWNYTEYKLLN